MVVYSRRHLTAIKQALAATAYSAHADLRFGLAGDVCIGARQAQAQASVYFCVYFCQMSVFALASHGGLVEHGSAPVVAA